MTSRTEIARVNYMKKTSTQQIKQLKMHAHGWLLLAKHHYENLMYVKNHLQELVGEEDDLGHVNDFVFSGNIDAKDLLKKVAKRNARNKKVR